MLNVGKTIVRLPEIRVETCFDASRSQINLNCLKHELSEVVPYLRECYES